MRKLDKQHEGSKNVIKLIVEYIPSKTTEQISDKRRGLHKSLVKREKDQDCKKQLEKRGNIMQTLDRRWMED